MKNNISILIVFIILTLAVPRLESQWVSQTSGTTQHLQKVAHYSSLPITITVGTGNTILKTTNDGVNWISITNPATTSLTDIFTVGSNTAYISGSGIVLKSTNGGSTWLATATVPNRFFNSIYFFNENTGWACGQTDTIIKTTNGGTNWSLLENNQLTGESNSAISFVNVLQGYMAGNNGTSGYILRTINGGTNWAQVLTNTDPIQCIEMKNATTGFAGSLGKIFKTTNGGANWSGITIGNNGSVLDLHFPVDSETGYAVTSFGKILKTTNSGENWYLLNSPSGSTILRGIRFKFNSNTTGYIAGNAGTILKTTNGGGSFVGVSNTGSEIPDKFSLSQNYPNPFNPETNIDFNIAASEHVKISIFDILGTEIEILINSDMTAGQYRVSWDAAKMPSGIYFCRMSSGSFTETRKMILNK